LKPQKFTHIHISILFEMKGCPMTADDIKARIESGSDDAQLVFLTPEGPAGKGYHVTELRHLEGQNIDCGGNVTHTSQSVLQLLDSATGSPMTLGKFKGILTQSLEALDGLGAASMAVEFAHRNDGLHLHEVAEIDAKDDKVVLLLKPRQATCRPAIVSLQTAGTAGCCNQGATQQRACCA
jgi:hypothetical protein